ncbi:hypothetical protein [Amycolatopsis magusensis]|uniref:hypothetical protein n=1 Tax=Amycolatopsis magusensis TaxID=882444 RepID=UPI003C30C17A
MTARRAELVGYSLLVLIGVVFAMLAGATNAPAAAPVLRTCPADRAIVAEVSAQLGEDLAAITVLGSSRPGVEAAGLVDLDDGRIHLSARLGCEHLADVLRHEFAHVLQWRTFGPRLSDRLPREGVEIVADEISHRWGSTYTPYLDKLGPPRAGHLAQVEALLCDQGSAR